MRLQTLVLSNFQGIRQLQLDFEGRSAAIYGRNGAGKTTIYNAFTWLLTGKSSTDSKGFTPKTNDREGGEVHNLDHSVEAVLSLENGQLVTLKKVFHEIWKKKRGHATADFSGNTIDYYINGVPTKGKDYDSFILEQFGGEERLKMLTMPDYFLQKLDPKKRRSALAEFFGSFSDEEIIQSDEELAELPDFLLIPGSDGQRYTVAEYRKIAAVRKSEINDRLGKLPERIDEAERSVADDDGRPLEGIEERILEIDTEVRRLERQVTALTQDTASASLDKQIYEATARLEEARALHLHAENERLASRRARVRTLLDEASSKRRDAARALMQKDFLLSEQKRLEAARAALLQEWEETNAWVWNQASETCPVCGQRLPESRIDQLRGDFNQKKSQKLTEISQRGKQECSLDKITKLGEQAHDHETLITQCKHSAEEMEQEAAELRESISEIPFEQTDEYRVLQDAVVQLRRRERDHSQRQEVERQRDAIEEKLASLREERDSLQKQVLARKFAERIRIRIRELEQEERDLAAEFERVEKGLYLCELFVRRQVSMIDQRINSHFRTIRFKLFREQNNGGIADCCEALIPSETGALVPYPDANNAARVNGGLETIGVLAEQFGISAPVFIDNAESVTDIIPIPAQVIQLVVAREDADIRIEVCHE